MMGGVSFIVTLYDLVLKIRNVNLEQRFKESIKAQQWAHTLPVIA
jgi:hypothetical protein